jgi:hypothetical protein
MRQAEHSISLARITYASSSSHSSVFFSQSSSGLPSFDTRPLWPCRLPLPVPATVSSYLLCPPSDNSRRHCHRRSQAHTLQCSASTSPVTPVLLSPPSASLSSSIRDPNMPNPMVKGVVRSVAKQPFPKWKILPVRRKGQKCSRRQYASIPISNISNHTPLLHQQLRPNASSLA